LAEFDLILLKEVLLLVPITIAIASFSLAFQQPVIIFQILLALLAGANCCKLYLVWGIFGFFTDLM
jgi:hypothetical protein